MEMDLDHQDITFRLGVPEDMPKILQLIVDLATYEGVPNGPKLTAQDLLRDGFNSERPWFFTLVAESKSRLVGYAICHYAYSSWLGRAMYIEDFYIEPKLRGQKLGHCLFKEICKIACEQGVQQIDWHVLKDNELAISFYQRHGAYDLATENRTPYRMKIEAIRAVAESSS